MVQRRFDKGLEFRCLVFLDAEGTVALFRDDAAFLRLVHDGVARDSVAELDGSQFLVRDVPAGLAEDPLEFGFRDQHFACEQMAERFFLFFVDGLEEAKHEVPEFVKRGKSFALDGECLVQDDNVEFFVDQAAHAVEGFRGVNLDDFHAVVFEQVDYVHDACKAELPFLADERCGHFDIFGGVGLDLGNVVFCGSGAADFLDVDVAFHQVGDGFAEAVLLFLRERALFAEAHGIHLHREGPEEVINGLAQRFGQRDDDAAVRCELAVLVLGNGHFRDDASHGRAKFVHREPLHDPGVFEPS